MRLFLIMKLLFNTDILKTIWFNFHYFHFFDACKFPVWLSKGISLRCLKGSVVLRDIVRPGIVRVGYSSLGFQDLRHSRCVWNVMGRVYIGGNLRIGKGCSICVGESGELSFGEECILTGNSTIVCQKKISIGNNFLMSWDCLVMDSDFHKIFDLKRQQVNCDKPIIIEDNVWIGCHSIVLKGSKISSMSVVAAGSTVSGLLNRSNSIYKDRLEIKNNIVWGK